MSSRCGRSGIPVEGARGRGGSYRLRPGYRVPPLMFTTGEAVAVTLGLMAARRLGLEAESALGKVRRVLPDRVRLPVESLEGMLGFTDRGRGRAARRRDPAHARRRRPPRPQGDRPLPRLPGHRDRAHVQPVRRRRPTAAAGTSPPSTTAASELRALRADRVVEGQRSAAQASPAPAHFDAVAFVSRTLARVPWAHEVEVVLHTDPATAARHFPPTLAELEPHPRRHPPDDARGVAGLGRPAARRLRLRLRRPRRPTSCARDCGRSPSGF